MTSLKLGTDGQDIFLGRQSIVDRDQNLRAFELLFRSSQRNHAEVNSPTAATATVINYALTELGIESLLGSYRGFINLDEQMLLSDAIELLPRDKIVLEILETVTPTPAVVQRCRQLRDKGFTLAMDDFVRHDPSLMPLLALTHIVKVDVPMLDPGGLARTVALLRGTGVQLLAEKVDDIEQFRRCLDLGFDLFQGYYFAKPEIITGKRLSSSEMIVMRLVGMLMTDADTTEIEKVFKQDPGLSVNLLRMVNSVATGTRGKKITSLTSALIVLGRRQVQRWLQLLMFAKLSPGREFPSPLLQFAAARGKFMELMATGDKTFEDYAFMTGIMSLMDALLGMPLAQIIGGLPVADEIREALLDRTGRVGRLLTLAEAVERNDEAGIMAAGHTLRGCSEWQIHQAQMQALRWANSIAQPGD